MLTQNVVDDFILQVNIIDPINDIIKKLQQGYFRDCDVKWLENKLKIYIEFAAKTMFLTIEPMANSESYSIMNDYTKKRLIEKFTTLLNYFKSF